MTRDEAISHIKSIYDPDENSTGRAMLLGIILDEIGWYNLPDEIIIRLGELQVASQSD